MAVAMGAQQAKALLFLVVAVVFTTSGARGDRHTWISNGASRGIVATTSYAGGTSHFVNRLIPPGKSDYDEYSSALAIHVELWVEGAGQHNSVNIPSDRSLVGYDHGGGTTGIDIYLARFGTLFQTDGPVLVTIFLNGLKNETTTNTTTVTTHDLD